MNDKEDRTQMAGIRCFLTSLLNDNMYYVNETQQHHYFLLEENRNQDGQQDIRALSQLIKFNGRALFFLYQDEN